MTEVGREMTHYNIWGLAEETIRLFRSGKGWGRKRWKERECLCIYCMWVCDSSSSFPIYNCNSSRTCWWRRWFGKKAQLSRGEEALHPPMNPIQLKLPSEPKFCVATIFHLILFVSQRGRSEREREIEKSCNFLISKSLIEESLSSKWSCNNCE